MPTTTTVPLFRATFIANLSARSNLSGVQVTRSYTDAAQQPEQIYLGTVHGTVIKPVFRGPARAVRQETYMCDVEISVTSVGGDSQTAEERAFSFMAEIENMLADDPTVGGIVQNAYPEGYEMTSGADASRGGFACDIKVIVAVEARLT